MPSPPPRRRLRQPTTPTSPQPPQLQRSPRISLPILSPQPSLLDESQVSFLQMLSSPASGLDSPVSNVWPSSEKPRRSPRLAEMEMAKQGLQSTPPPPPPDLYSEREEHSPPATGNRTSEMPAPPEPDPNTGSTATEADTQYYAIHPAYTEVLRLRVTVEPARDKPEDWHIPYAIISHLIEVAVMEGRNQYGLPDADSISNFAFSETHPPYSTVDLVLPRSDAATMQAIMGGAHEILISDRKATVKISDASQIDYMLRQKAMEKERAAAAKAEERRWRLDNTRKVIVKPNHHPGIPPLTLDRAAELLAQHFSHVSGAAFLPQQIRGVTVQGVYTNHVFAWVGAPWGGLSVPQMLTDSHCSYAKWEYYFAVASKNACKRCHQSWTPCATEGKWWLCAPHCYFARQKQRHEQGPHKRPRPAATARRSRRSLTKEDICNNTKALSTAMQRSLH